MSNLWLFDAYTLLGLSALLFVLLALGCGALLVFHLLRLLYRTLRGRRDRGLDRHVESALAHFANQPTVRIDMRRFHQDLADAGLLLGTEDPR